MPTTAIPPGLLSSRNYPGFLGALFLVLLRIAIGWHFLTEGLDKVESTRYGKQPFSAEIYLRNAAGPLAPQFRSMLPDPDGLALLDSSRLKTGLGRERRTHREATTSSPTSRRPRPRRCSSRAYAWADVWFNTYDNREAREKYLHELTQVRRPSGTPTPCRSSVNGPGSEAHPGGGPQEADRAAGRERSGARRRGHRPGDAGAAGIRGCLYGPAHLPRRRQPADDVRAVHHRASA